jgi:hypothetical protein
LCETNSWRAICGPLSSLARSPERLQLPLGQHLRRRRDWASCPGGIAVAGWAEAEHATRVVTSGALALGVTQQLHHGGAFVQEEPHVAIWFRRLSPGFAQGLQCLRPMSLRVRCQSLKHADLDETPGASRGRGGFVACSTHSKAIRSLADHRKEYGDTSPT